MAFFLRLYTGKQTWVVLLIGCAAVFATAASLPMFIAGVIIPALFLEFYCIIVRIICCLSMLFPVGIYVFSALAMSRKAMRWQFYFAITGVAIGCFNVGGLCGLILFHTVQTLKCSSKCMVYIVDYLAYCVCGLGQLFISALLFIHCVKIVNLLVSMRTAPMDDLSTSETEMVRETPRPYFPVSVRSSFETLTAGVSAADLKRLVDQMLRKEAESIGKPVGALNEQVAMDTPQHEEKQAVAEDKSSTADESKVPKVRIGVEGESDDSEVGEKIEKESGKMKENLENKSYEETIYISKKHKRSKVRVQKKDERSGDWFDGYGND